MHGLRCIKKEQGFTLIELMIGIMILSLVFGVASSSLGNMVRWGFDMELETELQQEGKWALEMMSRELRYSDVLYPNLSLSLPADFNYITFTKTNASGDSEEITYGRGSDAGLSAGTCLGRKGAGGANPVIDPRYAIIANAADLNFHVNKSGDNGISSEIIITLKLTGVRDGAPVRTAVFETTVYKLNGN